MDWVTIGAGAGMAASAATFAATYRLRAVRLRREHLISVHYGAPLFLFPDRIRDTLTSQLRIAEAMGGQGRAVSIVPVPGVGAAWLCMELGEAGNIQHSAGYARSVRAAKRRTARPARERFRAGATRPG